MHKKLTITVDEAVYKGLHQVIGRGHISSFIEDLVRPHVLKKNLDSAYQELASDEKREEQAEIWAEEMIADVADETR